MLPLPLVALVLAIVLGCVQRLYRPAERGPAREQSPIFVCMVGVDCDCLEALLCLVRAARHPARIVVGVLEYVERASRSVLNRIPDELRPRVRVHTHARTRWRGVRAARQACFEHLATDEPLALCVENHVRMLRDWDVFLETLASPTHVLTGIAHATTQPRFPVLRREGGAVRVKSRRFVLCKDAAVACVASGSWWFGRPEAVRRALRGEPAPLRTPARSVALGAWAPARAPRGASDTAHAQVGLSEDPAVDECVTKFGSVTAAHLAVRLREDRVAESA